MNLTLLFPGAAISLLLLLFLFKRLNLKPIKLKKPYLDVNKIDNFLRNLFFIAFFGMVFVGIWLIFIPAAFIICGIAGLWFCFPRGK